MFFLSKLVSSSLQNYFLLLSCPIDVVGLLFFCIKKIIMCVRFDFCNWLLILAVVFWRMGGREGDCTVVCYLLRLFLGDKGCSEFGLGELEVQEWE